MNRIRYASRALREADELIKYIERQDPAIAGGVANAIEHALRLVATDPRRATQTDAKGIRRYAIRRYGIAIYVRHRPRKQVLEVVRVVRGKRVKALSQMP